MDFLNQQFCIQQRHVELMQGFDPHLIKAPLHIFWAEESKRKTGTGINLLTLSNATRESTQRELPGTHENMILLDENVDVIATILARKILQTPTH